MSKPLSWRPMLACLVGVGLLAGCDRQSPAPGQANAQSPAANSSVASADEVTAAPAATPPPAAAASKIDYSHKGEAALGVGFLDPAGKPVTITAFKGKPLLLNLWATWCAPCVAEMPTLDAAARALAGKVQVIAVSQDLEGAKKVAPFFAAKNYTTLKPYLDPKLGLSLGYQANLPTTILYDSTGHEVWRTTGGYAWDTPDAAKHIAEAS